MAAKSTTNVTATTALDALPRDRIEDFCRRWKITELAVFGSILREDFGPDSDVDFLVTFAPEADWTLLDLVGMEHELEDMLGHEIDLVEKLSVERSHNRIRRKEILGTAEVVYAAG